MNDSVLPGNGLTSQQQELQSRQLQCDSQLNARPHTFVSQSAKIRKLRKMAVKVAKSSASVMLTGESGTGKELFAQLIHQSSKRAKQPFVRVNCAALPSNLIESELFGHERGSFTDAVQERAGRFELAKGGTLLLDEISEVPVGTQAKLLRVLEENEFERVGGNETIHTDVRVVATSNQDLRQAIENGTFRLDLYHRLNVIQIQIPALRDRPMDIPLLATHFVKRFQNENEIRIQGFTPDAIQALCRYDWPGNVRELRNLIHRACILTTQPLIDVCCLESLHESDPPPSKFTMPEQWLQTKLADIEKQIIVAAVHKFGNKRIVAEKLGVSTRTLSNKLRLYRESSDDQAGLDSEEGTARKAA